MVQNPLTIKCPRCGMPIEGITEQDIPLCIPCTLADWQERQREENRGQEGKSEPPEREYDEG